MTDIDTDTTLDRDGWRTLLDRADAPTHGALVATVDRTDMIDPDADPEELVDAALANGALVEDPDAGAFGEIHVADDAPDPSNTTDTTVEEPDPPDANPGGEADKPPSGTDPVDGWGAVDFVDAEQGVYPPEHDRAEVWMGAVGKQAFAPWGDADHSDADPDKDARWKWGLADNYADGPTVDEWLDKDPRLTGRAFIQRESDPYAFVDGDDVRDPDTGEVHPAFRAILSHLGFTYADVSTSGAGIHAYYRGELPIDGKGQAAFEIDTEPWGANDAAPTVEIYANTHLSITNGEHVVGTPRAVAEWDADALRSILKANGYDDRDPVAHDTDRDDPVLEEYDPVATTSDEPAGDVRDVLKAVDRLDARDLPLRTRRTGEDATGWETYDPSYRSSESGESVHSPSNEAVFYDHKEGESFGVLALFAAEEGILSKPWDRLEGGDWWDAVDAARDAGAPIPQYDPDADRDPVAALPTGALDALAPDERERYARKRGIEIPSTDDARRRLRDAVFRELRAGNSTVVDAPTALGKSYTVAAEPWLRRTDVTGDAPVIHLHPTTDARDDALDDSRATSGVDAAVLRGRREASPLAAGEYDPVEDPDTDAEEPDVVVTIDGEPASDWFDRMCDRKGLPFSTALAIARDRNDQDLDELPPIGEEDPAVAQWDGLPRDDDGEPAVDVIHATHQFAYVPSLRSHTNVIIDEQPDYAVDLPQDRIRRAVNAYLRAIDAPVSTWEAFIQLARLDADGRSDAQAERDAVDDALGTDPGREWYVEDPDAHALAPDLAKAIWNALRWEDVDSNGRRSTKVLHEPPRFDADAGGYTAGTWLSVVVDDENTVRSVRSTPDFSQARAVVGLDAHPSMPLWELNGPPGIDRDAVLDPTERRLWRRYERGLTVVQVGDAARPRSGDNAREWMNDDRVRALLDRLREHYGHGFKTALATVQTEPALRRLLADVAGDGVDRDSTMHYGEERSRNDFAGEPAGYVYGCMDPGDEMILDTLAELGQDATPATAEDDDGEEHREKGRTFDGPDADTAAAVLASVRENHVAQAAGRYARDADDPDRSAVVYVDTNAAPEGFVDLDAPGVEWLATDLQAEIIDALADRPHATTRELADAVGCSKEHVRDTLDRLADRELVARRERAGADGADVYRDADADTALLDLALDGTTNDALCNSNRWSLAVHDRHAPPSDALGGTPRSRTGLDAVAGGSDPPDPGD